MDPFERKRKELRRKWIENFKRSPLVDKATGAFRSQFAHQLFFGKKDDTYPSAFPSNFDQFYGDCEEIDRETAVDTLVEFLHFIGIGIRKESISKYLESHPDEFRKLSKKCLYIFKALAHYDDRLDVGDPYHDNKGDLFFLLRVETGEQSQTDLFEDDLELPVLYGRLSVLPDGYEQDPLLKELFRKIESTNISYFVTGKAGTGKSTFVQYFVQKTQKKVLLTAFTGIAAINVGGQTIHSFFQFPFKPLLPEDDEIKTFRQHDQKHKIIEELDTIVIDEVSMLRADVLEAIDYSLRINGGNPDQIFGGKQMLFVGDVFQLPPVLDSTDEVEKELFGGVYGSEYFFDSPAYKAISPRFFELPTPHRHKDDSGFVDLLDKVRVCKTDDVALDKLNQRFNPTYSPEPNEFIINLTSNNAIANTENIKRLRQLQHSSYFFEAEITGEYSEDRYPTTPSLELKRNAQVILIKNDAARRWVNGTIAKIDFISDKCVEIRLQDGSRYALEKLVWENRRYKYNREKKRIVSEVIGTFKQYPIKLAWAITIHKSQGLTFDNVIIDLGSGAFVNGQVYTALSRCRTLDGITLKRKLRREDMIADERLTNWYESEQMLCSLMQDIDSLDDNHIT